MAYRIVFSSFAERDILSTSEFIEKQSGSARAYRWEDGLLEAISTLDTMPLRCPLADEAIDLDLDLRELHFFSHRVIFFVHQPSNTVEIMRVYHTARAPLEADDLP